MILGTLFLDLSILSQTSKENQTGYYFAPVNLFRGIIVIEINFFPINITVIDSGQPGFHVGKFIIHEI